MPRGVTKHSRTNVRESAPFLLQGAGGNRAHLGLIPMPYRIAAGFYGAEACDALCLARDDIHLWSVNLALPADSVAALAGTLSPDERRRAARFHFERDRDRFTTCRAMLRIVLSSYGCGNARQLRFSYGEKGKPALEHGQAGLPIEFNLAHSHDLALIAVARDQAVGIDVEFVRSITDLPGVAGQVCSHSEMRSLLSLPAGEQCASFLRCWTRKEAYVKALGVGLSFPLDRLHVGCSTLGLKEATRIIKAQPDDGPVCWLRDLRPATGYVGALASRRRDGQITCFDTDGCHLFPNGWELWWRGGCCDAQGRSAGEGDRQRGHEDMKQDR